MIPKRNCSTSLSQAASLSGCGPEPLETKDLSHGIPLGCMLLAGTVMLLQLFGGGYKSNLTFDQQHERVLYINELAGRIQSQAEARAYVNELADLLSATDPYWAAPAMLERIARAEYTARLGHSALVSEETVVEAFNRFADEIGAPATTHVTAAEIHEMRVGMYTWAKHLSSTFPQMMTVFTMPNIYAIEPNGELAAGCRPVEAVQVLSVLLDRFVNLSRARDRLLRARHPTRVPKKVAAQATRWVLRSGPLRDPLEQAFRNAQQDYIRKHGSAGYRSRAAALFAALIK